MNIKIIKAVDAKNKGITLINPFITNNDSDERKCCKTLYVREHKDVTSFGKQYSDLSGSLKGIMEELEDVFVDEGIESIVRFVPAITLYRYFKQNIMSVPDFQRRAGIKSKKEKSDIAGSFIVGDTESIGNIEVIFNPEKRFDQTEVFIIQDGLQRLSTIIDVIDALEKNGSFCLASTRVGDFDGKALANVIKNVSGWKENVYNTPIKVTFVHSSNFHQASDKFDTCNAKQTKSSKQENIHAEYCQNQFYVAANELCDNEHGEYYDMISTIFGNASKNTRFGMVTNLIGVLGLVDYAMANEDDRQEMTFINSGTDASSIARAYLNAASVGQGKVQLAFAEDAFAKMLEHFQECRTMCGRYRLIDKDGNAIRGKENPNIYEDWYKPYFHAGNLCLTHTAFYVAAYRYMIANKYTEKQIKSARVVIDHFLAKVLPKDHSPLKKSFKNSIDVLFNRISLANLSNSMEEVKTTI